MSTPPANLSLFLEHVFPLDQPFRGLVLLTGHSSVLRLSQLLSLQYVRRGHPVVLVDGANAFDPLLFSDAARAHHLDLTLMLGAVHLSRAFTCHQLEVLLTERLQTAVETLHPRAVLCLGLLDLLDDEDVPATEAVRIFRHILPAVGAVCRRLPVLAACPDPAGRVITPGVIVQRRPRGALGGLGTSVPSRGGGALRRQFCGRLRAMARWHFTARPVPLGLRREPERACANTREEAIVIARERPAPAQWEWTLALRPQHAFRRPC